MTAPPTPAPAPPREIPRYPVPPTLPVDLDGALMVLAGHGGGLDGAALRSIENPDVPFEPPDVRRLNPGDQLPVGKALQIVALAIAEKRMQTYRPPAPVKPEPIAAQFIPNPNDPTLTYQKLAETPAVLLEFSKRHPERANELFGIFNRSRSR